MPRTSRLAAESPSRYALSSMGNHENLPDTGLGLHDLRLVPHDPSWVACFEREAKRLAAIPHTLRIEHVGSTALPDIATKPVVDVAMMVEAAHDDAGVLAALQAAGYSDHGEYGLPGRRFFTLGEPPRIHLHVVSKGSPYWTDWLAFRDFLRRNKSWRAMYEKEKFRILAEVGGNRALYTSRKGAFIKRALTVAANEGLADR